VGRKGQVIYQRGYGMANLEYDVPLTANSIVEIGSVSKQFTAASVLLLAQRGILSLEDDIRKWLPEVPDFGNKITIRMLANHTSGLRDQWGLLGLMNSPPGSAVHTPELVLDLVTRQRDVNFKPNDQYLYSNTGYTLLGIIVKRASGKSLAEFSRENIFQPLGMNNTQWRDDFERVVKGRATAYSRSTGNTYRQEMPFTNVYGNGGLLTTVADLITWYDALYNNKLGGPDFLSQLTTSGVLNSKHKIAYALGVSNGMYRGLRQITHSGSTAGYRANLVSFPDSRTTIAVLCNNATANTGAHVNAVADIVLANELKPPRAEVKAANDIDVSRYAGMYRDVATDETYRFELRDGRLIASGLELVATGTDTLRDARRNTLVLALTDKGASKLRIIAGEDPPTDLVKVAEIKPTDAELREYVGTYTSPELGVTYSVSVNNGNLVLTRRLQNDLTLMPTYKDAFSSSGTWIFTRDGAGKVNSLLYTQGRVRRVRFVKAI
jgi:CubicO group peptidase (beta-lactamase class C family)